MDDEICEAMIIIATIFDVMVLKQGEKKTKLHGTSFTKSETLNYKVDRKGIRHQWISRISRQYHKH